MWSLALKFLGGWFKDIKNIIITFLAVVIILLFIRSFFLTTQINDLKNTIGKKDIEIGQLKLSIEKQNTAISNMNEDFKKEKEAFDKRYAELEKTNASKLKYLEKQRAYQSPKDKTEVDASRDVVKDFLKTRRLP